MISGDDACCSVVLGTLVDVFVFSVMWFRLLLTSAISCLMWSSVYECQRVECSITSQVCTVCSVVCLCQLFCSVWMCCLEEVYKCLQL